MSEIDERLLSSYEARCIQDGVSFEAFLDEAATEHASEALMALVERVEADVLENLELMREAQPALADTVEARRTEVRAEMARLRARIEGAS